MRLELLSDVPHVREHPSWARLWSVWPEFMSHDPVANEYFPRLRTELARRGFADFAEFEEGAATALLARKRPSP